MVRPSRVSTAATESRSARLLILRNGPRAWYRPSRTFSQTAWSSTRPRFWWTTDTPASRCSIGWTGVRRRLPSTTMEPPGSGVYTPVRIFTSVDFPHPFWPTMPCSSPGATVSWMSRSTRAGPKVFDR